MSLHMEEKKRTLLSPSLEQNITKSDIVFIKEALFEYISESKHKM